LRSNLSDLPSGPVLPLDQMRGGETGEIIDVRGGRGVVRRLTEIGLAPGTRVRMVSGAGRSGPLIVNVGDAKIGLGRGMARRVLVRQSAQGSP
jgi:ferrous iron transport protein A